MPSDQKLAFVPMDPEKLPVSTLCASIRVYLAVGTCGCATVRVCVREYLGAVCVHRRVCKGAGAERLSVGDCVCMQEGACGSVCGAGGAPIQGSAAVCAVSVCEGTCVHRWLGCGQVGGRLCELL